MTYDFIKDSYEKYWASGEYEEFFAFLKELDECSKWDSFPLKDVSFIPASSIDATALGIGGEEALEDTVTGPIPVVAILPSGKSACMRPYLWKQIKQHHRDAAAVLSDMLAANNVKAATDHLNMSRPFLKKNVLALFRGDKISGWFGEYNTNWSETMQLTFLEEHLSATFPNRKFEGASYNHIMTTAFYQLDQSIVSDDFTDAVGEPHVMESYIDAWHDAGLNPEELRRAIPVVRFTTGESGMTSIVLSPFLRIGKHEMPLGPSMSVTHRGSDEKVWGKFEAFADGLCSMYQSGFRALEDICKREILHPYACATRVLKMFASSMPKKVLEEEAESIKMFYDPDDDTQHCRAIDIYQDISDMIMLENEKLSPVKRLQNLEMLARILVANWGTFDVSKPVKLSSGKMTDDIDDTFGVL